jgi:hypothetical protein
VFAPILSELNETGNPDIERLKLGKTFLYPMAKPDPFTSILPETAFEYGRDLEKTNALAGMLLLTIITVSLKSGLPCAIELMAEKLMLIVSNKMCLSFNNDLIGICDID